MAALAMGEYKQDEIEITPEMIEAGESIIWEQMTGSDLNQ